MAPSNGCCAVDRCNAQRIHRHARPAQVAGLQTHIMWCGYCMLVFLCLQSSVSASLLGGAANETSTAARACTAALRRAADLLATCAEVRTQMAHSGLWFRFRERLGLMETPCTRQAVKLYSRWYLPPCSLLTARADELLGREAGIQPRVCCSFHRSCTVGLLSFCEAWFLCIRWPLPALCDHVSASR